MKAISALLSILLSCSLTAAATADQAAQPPGRPRIGLVLAGGGAKGGAHVGVLKVLEEMRVPVDCIAGTSMGALIGAGYAAGQPAAELETFISGIDWSQVVGGAGRRALKPVEENRMATEAQSDVKVGLKDGRIVTPAGLVDTSNIDDLLRTYVAQARMVNVFDELPIPFRAVATDMVTANMVVLKDGDLATAMRASMAIPGAFSPVPVGDMVLSDGGMVRNIPVDVAREMCADVVIVVNLVESPMSPDRLVQATELLSRSMAIGIIANEAIQLGVPRANATSASTCRWATSRPRISSECRKRFHSARRLRAPWPARSRPMRCLPPNTPPGARQSPSNRMSNGT